MTPNSANVFLDIVSGRRRSLAARAARVVLRTAAVPVRWGVAGRNWRYDHGHTTVHHVGVPVISVGNITMGGTGKTPMVKHLVRLLAELGLRAAIVSRGYGARDGAPNDEALELATACPEIPHVQNADRVAAARQAIDQHGAQVIVADDAFQHRRLARDLDIVLIDALEPFGFGHLFPRGTLREPVAALRRAQVVCLTRADMIEPAARHAIRQRVMQVAPQIVWCEVMHAPTRLLTAKGDDVVGALRGRRCAAFCGIGNPAGFRLTLEKMGAQVVAWRELPDHYAYARGDLAALDAWVSATDVEAVVCTHKDWVKLERTQIGDRRLLAVVVEMEFQQGQAELEAAVREVVHAGQLNRRA